MWKHIYRILIIGLLLPLQLGAQNSSKQDLLNQIRTYRKNHEYEILKEYFQLLSIPNVSSDRSNVRKNAEFIRKMMGS